MPKCAKKDNESDICGSKAQSKTNQMKTVVVTGATKGIGRAISKKFAQNGHSLAICSRNNQELKELSKELMDMGAPKVFYEQCDVAQKDDLEMFAENLLGEMEQVDILVNNAGVFIPGKVTEEPDGALETMIETNLYSAYRLTRHLMPSLRHSLNGHIFNICSIASFMAYENGGSYSISKFAMLGMSKVLRAELLQSNIKVTAVMPGATYTASWEASGLDPQRFAQSEEIADMIYATNQLTGNAVVEELIIRPQLGDI